MLYQLTMLHKAWNQIYNMYNNLIALYHFKKMINRVIKYLQNN